MNISLITLSGALLFSSVGFANHIIPAPSQIEYTEGQFALTANTSINAPKELVKEAKALQALISPATGIKLPINAKNKQQSIELKLDNTLSSLGKEGYKLKVTKGSIIITAHKPAGVFYGSLGGLGLFLRRRS